MPQLFLVRHAKSDHGIDGIRDIERPLNSRGYADAATIAARFTKKEAKPDLLISSPAVRAYSTALIFAKEFGMDAGAIQLSPELYEAGEKAYIFIAKKALQIHKRIMIFGHNPDISATAANLINSTITELPTCGTIGIQLKNSGDIDKNNNEICYFDFPKISQG